MAKKAQQQEVKAGAPPWMASFSDMMSLLLCFFVLLYAMSENAITEEALAAFLSAFGNPNFAPQIAIVQPATAPAIGAQFGSGMLQIPVPSQNVGEREADSLGMDVDIQAAMQTIVSEFETYFIESENPLAQEIEINVFEDRIELNFPSDMTFATGSSVLTHTTLEVLDYIGSVLEDFPMFNILIQGHTDNVPIRTVRYPNNDWLGFGRAHSVQTHFRNNHNIDPTRLRSESFGEYSPVADNDTPEGRALNRRVEILIVAP